MLRFQSTFPRGERRFLRGGSRLVSYFNPRSLVGNDVLRRAACPLLFYFNPRSLVGNDSASLYACSSSLRRFQSTFPRGERRRCRISYHESFHISIHVPSWGTTVLYLLIVKTNKFQSTFPRGERRGPQKPMTII